MNVAPVRLSQLNGRWHASAVEVARFREAHPCFVPLGEYVEEVSILVRPASEPEKIWPVYGVDNVRGVFLSHHQAGTEFRQHYKRIQPGWFVHNPTRANVGSFGLVHEVEEDAIVSSDYQVWRLTGGYIPQFLAIVFKTQVFRYLVSIHRVGAVKQRLFVRNLKEIPLPRLSFDLQREMLSRWESAEREALASRKSAESLLQQAEEAVVTGVGCPPECLRPREEFRFTVRWSDVERWDFPFYRPDYLSLHRWLESQNARPLGDLVEFRSDGWSASDFPLGEFPYIEIGSVDPVQGIVSTEPVSVTDAPSRARYRVRAGDILIATTRPYLKKIAAVPPELDGAVCSSGFSVIAAVQRGLDRRYLLAVLRSPIVLRQFERRMSGGAYPAISQDQLERVQVPVPASDVQARIGAYVEQLWGRASRELARARQILQEALRPFEELLSGGCGSDGDGQPA